MLHFTVDVEEYFHPTALEATYPFESWEELPRRSPGIVDRVLDLLAERKVQGTFFVLGWLAEREPEMVRRIAAGGHEIASHGWRHRLLTRLTPEQFRESVARSRKVLEDVSGERVVGYRAPSFSIVPGGEWAFDILLEEGYRYDSSLVPVRLHPTYGYPSASPDPHWIERPNGRIYEIPITTVAWMGTPIPMSGGAYFRFAPYTLTRSAFRAAEGRGHPGVFYIHPWELDPDPPRLDVRWITRLRTLGSLGDTWGKVERLARDFEVARMDRTLEAASANGGET